MYAARRWGMMGDDHGGAVEGHIQFVLEPCAVRVEQGFEFRRGQIASWNGVGLYADEVAYKAQCLFNGLRSDARRVGKECVGRCRSGGSPNNEKTNNNTT